MPATVTLNYGPAAARFLSRMQGYAQAVHGEGGKAVQAQMASVRSQIVATSPVDTGRLQASWSPVTQRGGLAWGVGTALDYAPTLEYGGYPRVGKSGKTVRLGGGALGAGFAAGAGVYSRQAPLGFVRRALADAIDPLMLRLRHVVRQAWGKGGSGPAFTAATWTGGTGQRVMNLTPTQLGSLFGIPVVTSLRDL